MLGIVTGTHAKSVFRPPSYDSIAFYYNRVGIQLSVWCDFFQLWSVVDVYWLVGKLRMRLEGTKCARVKVGAPKMHTFLHCKLLRE